MCGYLKSAVLFVVMGVTIDGHGQTPANDSELQRILSKVRENYATASAWHFEHKITVEETEGTGLAVKLAEVIADHRQPCRAGKVRRCYRSGALRRALQASVEHDGTWHDDAGSRRHYYVGLCFDSRGIHEGLDPARRFNSVAGPTLLAAHLMPLGNLEAEAWTDVRLLDDGVLQVDGEKRDCFVIEATLKSNGLSLDSFGPGQPPPPPDTSIFSAPSGLFQLLQLAGAHECPVSGCLLRRNGGCACAHPFVDR